jgi:2-polyprenyl-3-methyl-5-hydroxy-6-metoxy-1,4-benzoquinol methylase
METDMKSYWNNRYEEGTIWGTIECPSAVLAHQYFEEQLVKNIIVPGCGYGRNSLYFAQKGFKVMGFDISDRAIHYAVDRANKLSLENLKYKVGSLFNLDFLHEEQFDGVYLSTEIDPSGKEETLKLWFVAAKKTIKRRK